MIVDNNYNKFNINKMSRSGSNSSSTSGTTVYLKSGNKVDNIKASLDVHYLWGNEFNGTQDVNGDIIAPDSSAIFKNLTITGTAKFFQLMVDKIKSVGGAIILSPADGFDIIQIGSGTYTLNGTTYTGVKLYFNADDNDVNIANTWQAGDMLIIQDFNTIDSEHNSTNRYFWGIVRAVDTLTESIYVNGSYMNAHYVILDANTYDGTMPDSSYVGASCVQLGNISDTTRDGAIYISAYDGLDTSLTAPFIAIYDGINTFSLSSSNRKTWFSMNGNQVSGTLMVYDSNNNNRVKISPASIGIVDSHSWQVNPVTEIGIDGFYSGTSDNFTWNGSDEIKLKHGNQALILLNNTGILRSRRVKTINGSSTNISYIAPNDAGYGYEDVSTCTNITKITPSSSVNNFNLDGNDGFVTVYNNSPQIAVQLNLPDPTLCTGCKIVIKGFHDVVVTRANKIIPAGDSTTTNSQNIGNDITTYWCDGTYWYEFKGI